MRESNEGKNGQRRAAIPFNSPRVVGNEAGLADSGRRNSVASWPGLWPKGLAGTGPIFLLAAGILLGTYPVLNYIKVTTANLKLDEPLHSVPAPQLPLAVGSQSSPSSNRPGIVAPAKRPLHEHVANVGPIVSGFSTPYPSMRYQATHKKAIGGCTGELDLTSTGLHFVCSSQADLNIPVNTIAKVHKDGVVLQSGEKYHFLIANHTKDQVEAIFILWLNGAQHPKQQGRRSSF